LKGLDYEEAIVCSVVLGLLVVSRHEFYRQADLFAVRPSAQWIVAVIVTVTASIWLGFFVWRNVEYQNLLWWDFAYRADAPRFMRATLGVVAGALGIGAYILMHRTHSAADMPSAEDKADVARIVACSRRSDAQLALLGDKHILFSEDRRCFVMFGVQGRSWIAMGDPVVDVDNATVDLVWRFKELV